jgi:hypothetical protein
MGRRGARTLVHLPAAIRPELATPPEHAPYGDEGHDERTQVGQLVGAESVDRGSTCNREASSRRPSFIDDPGDRALVRSGATFAFYIPLTIGPTVSRVAPVAGAAMFTPPRTNR